MASTNIGLREDVYERLKAHKRGNESFSETLDRILTDRDSDWRTHAGFLTDEAATELEAELERGLGALDDAVTDLGEEIDEELLEDA